MSTDQLQTIKLGQRAVWTAGDYGSVAEKIWEVGGSLVERLDPQPGERLLDVACGTGNVTIRAAQTGADVTGLDLTPKLLEEARANAAEAGVEIALVEGDAEELPFGDGEFGVVASSFGCMFAPRHRVTATEIARVTRPGGRIGICAWTPAGAIGQFFVTVGSHMPTPPEIAEPPPQWGNPDHVAEIFDATGLELSFERETVALRFNSLEDAVTSYERDFGPIAIARENLEPEAYAALVTDLRGLLERLGEQDETGIAITAEYLVISGEKRT